MTTSSIKTKEKKTRPRSTRGISLENISTQFHFETTIFKDSILKMWLFRFDNVGR